MNKKKKYDFSGYATKVGLKCAEVKRYAKVILAAPEGTRRVEIHTFKTREEAEAKSGRLKSWPYKVIVRARNKRGQFAKGFALICCK